MIVLLMGLMDLFVGFLMAGTYFDFLPWRMSFIGAVLLITKGIIFNDRFLSFMDMIAGLYIFLLIFVQFGSWAFYIFLAYFIYKFLISAF